MLCCFPSYLLQPIFILGKEDYQVLIWWEVAAADQLWIDPQDRRRRMKAESRQIPQKLAARLKFFTDPQDCPALAVPGGAPPSKDTLLIFDYSGHRVCGLGFWAVNHLYCLINLMHHIFIHIVMDFDRLGEPPCVLHFVQSFL